MIKIRKEYLIIFFAALLLRFLLAGALYYYFGEAGFSTKDARGQYLPLAKNIAQGNGFTVDGVTPYAYKTPGYSVFLAFFYKFFGVFWPAIIIQTILSASLAVLIFKIGENAGFDKKISRLAGMLTAVAPHLIYYGEVYVTEALFAFLLLLGILFFIKFLKEPNLKYSLLAGLFLGLDTLVKISTIYLLFVCLLAALFFILRSAAEIRKKLVFYFLIFIFIFIAVITPLSIRNYRLFGTFNLNSQGAYLLYRYEGASIVYLRDKVSFGEAEEIAREELLSGTGLENIPEHKLVDLKYAAVLKKKTFDLMKDNPWLVFKIELVNIFAFWTHSNYAYFLLYYKLISPPAPSLLAPTYTIASGNFGQLWETMKPILFSPYYCIALISRIYWVTIAALSFCSMGYAVFSKSLVDHKKILISFLFLTVVYYGIILAPLGFGVEARLRYHVEPLMFLLASFSFTNIYPGIKNLARSLGRIKIK